MTYPFPRRQSSPHGRPQHTAVGRRRRWLVALLVLVVALVAFGLGVLAGRATSTPATHTPTSTSPPSEAAAAPAQRAPAPPALPASTGGDPR